MVNERMIMDTNENEKIDTWGVCEVMGRQTFAGRISEHTIGGTALLRVDVPAVPEKKIPPTWSGDQERVLPPQNAFTKYIGLGSIYALTPCTEEVARRVAEQARKYPVDLVAMPVVETLALTARDGDELGQDDNPDF